MARARLLDAAALLLALLTLALASGARSSAPASGTREMHEDDKGLAESDDVAHDQPGVLCCSVLC